MGNPRPASHIAETKQRLADIEGDMELRNGWDTAEFSMTVGNRLLSGKGAREEAAKAVTVTILSWRDDQTIQQREQFRGFDILGKGKSAFRSYSSGAERCIPRT